METYNERLFGKGVRKKIHLARFNWLKRTCGEYSVSYNLVVELGCYDGRAIDFLPKRPKQYYGFDVGQDGGINAAMEKYRDESFAFIISSSPSDLEIPNKCATLIISLETLEHIKPDDLEDYFKKISNMMAINSYFLITVPNEKGIIFLFKYLSKTLYYGHTQEYTLREFCAAALGKTRLVKRNTHKGFDWEQLVDQLEKYFTINNVQGIQMPWLPPSLNVTIGIICSK